jgi:hypothetical protein
MTIIAFIAVKETVLNCKPAKTHTQSPVRRFLVSISGNHFAWTEKLYFSAWESL